MDGEISPETLAERLDDDEPVIVDIRRPAEFEREHIPGSLNVPFPQLPQEVDRLAGEEHVVTVCPHGKASVRAARLVASYEGFDGRVESLERGLSGWEGPLEPESQSAASDDRADTSPDAPF